MCIKVNIFYNEYLYKRRKIKLNLHDLSYGLFDQKGDKTCSKMVTSISIYGLQTDYSA